MIATIEGKNSYLISAPHVFSHYRRNLDSVMKQGEPWTDTIVKEVCLSSGSHGIFLEKAVGYDPNSDLLEVNPYKQEVDRMVSKGKIKGFIDIHGLSDRHSYDFAIYFPLRYRKSQELAYKLAEFLSKGVLKNSLVVVLNMKDNDQETLTEFIAKKRKIPSLQLEIARYIRDDEELRTSLTEALSEFLIKI